MMVVFDQHHFYFCFVHYLGLQCKILKVTVMSRMTPSILSSKTQKEVTALQDLQYKDNFHQLASKQAERMNIQVARDNMFLCLSSNIVCLSYMSSLCPVLYLNSVFFQNYISSITYKTYGKYGIQQYIELPSETARQFYFSVYFICR